MSVLQQLRQAGRSALKDLGPTSFAFLTLAFGFGATTMIASIVETVLLRPPVYPQPERIVRLWEKFAAQDPERRFSFSEVEFVDLAAQNQVFTQVGAYTFDLANVDLREGPEQILVARVSPSVFPLLGVGAKAGRTFAAEEDQPGTSQVAVLSDACWRGRFGADPAIVGQSIHLDGKSYSVVGVMPADFKFPGRFQPWGFAEMWLPLVIDKATLPAEHSGSQNRYLDVIARLRPGVSVTGGGSGLMTLSRQFRQRFPEAYPAESDWRMELAPMLDDDVRAIKKPLYILAAAGLLVLFITGANVANLMLIRLRRRGLEFAVRSALGASRSHTFRQLLVENLLLTWIGALFGLLLAKWGLGVLLAHIPAGIPRLDEVGLNPRIFLFVLLLATVLGVIVTAVSLRRQRRSSPGASIQQEGSRASASGTGKRLRWALVVLQVALALMVLIGASLLIKSFLRLEHADMGFDPDRLLTARISLSEQTYDEDAKVLGFFERLLEQAQGLPGVRKAALVSRLPFGGSTSSHGLTAEGHPVAADQPTHEVEFRSVSPEYFETMHTAVLAGRSFGPQDRAAAPSTVIVDQRLAELFWPGESAIGKRIKRGRIDSSRPWLEIVGVVRHVRSQEDPDAERDQIYYPLGQQPASSMTLVVSSVAEDPRPLAEAIRAEVLALDRHQPVANVRTMREWLDEATEKQRLTAFLFGLFATIAVLLAVAGTYGVIAAATQDQHKEIGIRVALGARRSEVLWLVLRRSLELAAIGSALGVAASLAASRYLASQLFEVSARDPAIFLGLPVALVAVVAAATCVPALRATRLDPVAVLRQD